MNKKFISICLFMVVLTPILFTSFVTGNELSSVTSNTDTNQPAPPSNTNNLFSISSEEENIDSFNVHPQHRWNVISESNTATQISDGLYKIDTTGSGIAETGYYMERGLSSYDDKINFRYKSNASEVSGIEGFAYQQEITINPSTDAGTNYQVNFTLSNATGTSTGNTIYLNGHSYNNFSDVSFYSGSTELDFWLNTKKEQRVGVGGALSGGVNKTWVKIPSDLTSGAIISILYGNATMSSASNGPATFEKFEDKILFDDFEGSYNTTLWNSSIGTPNVEEWVPSLEGRQAISHGRIFGGAPELSQAYPYTGVIENRRIHIWYYDFSGNTTDVRSTFGVSKSGDATYQSLIGVITDTSTGFYVYTKGTSILSTGIVRSTEWHEFVIEFDSDDNEIHFYVDDTYIDTYSKGTQESMTHFYIGTGLPGEEEYGMHDAFFMTKYADDIPTFSFSSEFVSGGGGEPTTDPSIFTIGLSDNGEPVVKFEALHYLAGNTTYNISLKDSGSNLWSNFYNETFDGMDLKFLEGKFSYDTLTSFFSFSLNFDNGTRIFSKVFPNDFTNDDSIIPQLFTIDAEFEVFVSSLTEFNARSVTYLDFIDAPFLINDWHLISYSTDKDILYRTQFAETAQATLSSQTDIWELAVPSLDAYSGSLFLDYSNGTVDSNDYYYVAIGFYTVDYDTGDTNLVVELRLTEPPGALVLPSNTYAFDTDSSGSTAKADFSFSLEQDRRISSFSASFTKNVTEEGIDQSLFVNRTLTSIGDKVSQEFVVQIKYYYSDLSPVAGAVTLGVQNTAFIRADIFSGIVKGVEDFVGGAANFVGDLLRGFTDIIFSFFLPLILFIAGVVVSAGDVLVSALSPLLNGIISAVGTIAGAISTLLEPVFQAISDALGAVATAIVGIAAEIWSALATAIGGIIEDIIDALALVIDALWNDVFLPIINLLLGIIGTILDAIIDGVQLVINAVITWALNLLGLTVIWGTASDFFDFVIALVFIVFLLGVSVLISGPIILSRNPDEIVENYWNIWSFDVTFGMSFLGIRIYIPFAFLMVSWILISGYANIIFPVVPF